MSFQNIPYGEESSNGQTYPVTQGAPPPYNALVVSEGNDIALFQQYAPSFDYSTVPHSYLVTPDQCPRVQPSTATFQVDGHIKSFDPVLDKNPDEIWKFFLTHMMAPKVVFEVHGHHTVRRRGRKGKSHTHRVTDFRFSVAINRFINPQWSAILAKPDPIKGQRSFDEIIKEYAASNSTLKDIIVHKELDWDLVTARKIIYDIVRATGYNRVININIIKLEDAVEINSSSTLSRASQNGCFKCLCFITCLCVVVYPMMWCARKNMDNMIVARFGVNLSMDEFYQVTYHIVTNNVNSRNPSGDLFIL